MMANTTAKKINGTQINVYDKLGLQVDDQGWSIESSWTPDGATCIGKGRIATSLVVPNPPQCMATRALVPCVTSLWPTNVVVRTEVNK
jgi:ADYC domain